MLLELLKGWPVDVQNSCLISNKPSDMTVGERAGLRSLLFGGTIDIEGTVSHIISREEC